MYLPDIVQHCRECIGNRAADGRGDKSPRIDMNHLTVFIIDCEEKFSVEIGACFVFERNSDTAV
jgi:hypothetical protein